MSTAEEAVTHTVELVPLVEVEAREGVGRSVAAAELVFTGSDIGGGGVVVVVHELAKSFASDLATFKHHVEINKEFLRKPFS